MLSVQASGDAVDQRRAMKRDVSQFAEKEEWTPSHRSEMVAPYCGGGTFAKSHRSRPDHGQDRRRAGMLHRGGDVTLYRRRVGGPAPVPPAGRTGRSPWWAGSGRAPCRCRSPAGRRGGECPIPDPAAALGVTRRMCSTGASRDRGEKGLDRRVTGSPPMKDSACAVPTLGLGPADSHTLWRRRPFPRRRSLPRRLAQDLATEHRSRPDSGPRTSEVRQPGHHGTRAQRRRAYQPQGVEER